MKIYVVERDSGDGLAIDLFEDKELAHKWAEHNDGIVYLSETIDAEALTELMGD